MDAFLFFESIEKPKKIKQKATHPTAGPPRTASPWGGLRILSFYVIEGLLGVAEQVEGRVEIV